jgi:hypothetical protein
LIVRSPFLVPCGDAAKLLVPVNQPLDLVPLAIARSVKGAGAMFIGLAWNGASDPAPTYVLPNLAAAIGFVTYQTVRAAFGATSPPSFDGTAGHQLGEDRGFVSLAWGQ